MPDRNDGVSRRRVTTGAAAITVGVMLSPVAGLAHVLPGDDVCAILRERAAHAVAAWREWRTACDELAAIEAARAKTRGMGRPYDELERYLALLWRKRETADKAAMALMGVFARRARNESEYAMQDALLPMWAEFTPKDVNELRRKVRARMENGRG